MDIKIMAMIEPKGRIIGSPGGRGYLQTIKELSCKEGPRLQGERINFYLIEEYLSPEEIIRCWNDSMDIFIIYLESDTSILQLIKDIRLHLSDIPIIAICPKFDNSSTRTEVLNEGADDCFAAHDISYVEALACIRALARRCRRG
jgi:hypothetical protein